jgi:hypothetical protein
MSKLIFRLMSRHHQIDAALRREQARRLPDFARLQRLKKLKLAVKDRLAMLTMRRKVAPQG